MDKVSSFRDFIYSYQMISRITFSTSYIRYLFPQTLKRIAMNRLLLSKLVVSWWY